MERFLQHCQSCADGEPIIKKDGRMVHLWRHANGLVDPQEAVWCHHYDFECRLTDEPDGQIVFAWLPVQCRNGKRRWLCRVERHADGTHTLGNRRR